MLRQVDFNTRYFPVVELGLLLFTLFNNLLAQGGSSTYLVEIETGARVSVLNSHSLFFGANSPGGCGQFPVIVDTLGHLMQFNTGECPTSVVVYNGISDGDNILGINYYNCYDSDSFPEVTVVNKLFKYSDSLNVIGSYVNMDLYDYVIRVILQEDSTYFALGYFFKGQNTSLMTIHLNNLLSEIRVDTLNMFGFLPLEPSVVKISDGIFWAIALRDSAPTNIYKSSIYKYSVVFHSFSLISSWQNTSPADQSKFYDIVSDETRLYVAAHDTLFCYDTNGVEIWKKIPDHFVQKLTYNPYNRTIAVSAYSTGYLQDIWFYDLDGNFITHTNLANVVEGVRDSVDQVFITNIFPRPDCGWLTLGAYRDLRSGEQRTFIMRTNPWGTLDPTGFCRPPQLPATGWQLYPNPSTDHVTLEAPSGIAPWQVQVYDMAGRLVYAPSTLNIDKLELTIAEWPEGIYAIVAVSENDILFSGRLLK